MQGESIVNVPISLFKLALKAWLLIVAFRRWRMEDCEVKASLGCKVNSRPVWVTVWNPVSKIKPYTYTPHWKCRIHVLCVCSLARVSRGKAFSYLPVIYLTKTKVRFHMEAVWDKDRILTILGRYIDVFNFFKYIYTHTIHIFLYLKGGREEVKNCKVWKSSKVNYNIKNHIQTNQSPILIKGNFIILPWISL